MPDKQVVKYERTEVPVEDTVAEISSLIRKYGGSRFEQSWGEDGSIRGVRFAIRHPEIGELPVSFTVKTSGVERVLREAGRRLKAEGQAERIAWRHIKDLTEQLLLAVQLELRSLPAAFMAEIETIDRETGETVTMEEFFNRRAMLSPGGGGVELRAISGEMSREEAAELLAVHGGLVVLEYPVSRESVEAAYRHAAKTLHPDAGGNAEMFKLLQQAKAVLLGTVTG